MSTLLAWTINSRLGRILSHSIRTSNSIQSHVELDIQLQNFCDMEFNDSQFSITKTMPKEDRRALKMMEESTKLCDGHYEVALPWRVFPPDLPNNKMLAEHHLCLLRTRLMRDQALNRKYSCGGQTVILMAYHKSFRCRSTCLEVHLCQAVRAMVCERLQTTMTNT